MIESLMDAAGALLLMSCVNQGIALDAPLHPGPAPRTEVSNTIHCEGGRQATLAYANTYRFAEGSSGLQAALIGLDSSWYRLSDPEKTAVAAAIAAFGRIETVKGRCWEKDILIDVEGNEKTALDAVATGKLKDAIPLAMRIFKLRGRGAVEVSETIGGIARG